MIDRNQPLPEEVTADSEHVPGERIVNTECPFLLDVRPARAFRDKHLAGSVNIPAAVLTRRLFALPPRGRPIVLVDVDRGRAAGAARTLRERGYHDVQVRQLRTDRPPAGGWASGPESHRGWEPAAFLVEALGRIRDIADGREPLIDGQALDLACGAGRNAVHLGLRGVSTLGVDILPDSIHQSALLARLAGAPAGRTRFRTFDLTKQPERLLRPRHFAAVLCFRYLDRNLFPLIERALSPGGWIIFQTFLVDQRTRHGKPRSDRHLLRQGELGTAFSSLEPITYREGQEPDGNWYGTLLARRPE